MSKLLRLISLAGLLFSGIVAPMARAQDFDRRAMLENLSQEVFLPAHQTLLAESQNLLAAAYAYEAEPGPETLQALQAAWRQTSLAWEACEWLRFGRWMLYHGPIERLPADVEAVEALIAGADPLEAATVAGGGSSRKGLPVLEYLLFADEEALSQPRRLAYLLAVTETLAADVQALSDFWGDYAREFAEADGAGAVVRESLSMLTNQMAAEVERLLQFKLGRPLGLLAEDGQARPELLEAPYSGHSLPQIQANLAALKLAFMGGEGLGLDDYLVFLGAGALAEAIEAQFDQALGLAAEFAAQGPLEELILQAPDEVERLYEAIQGLMVLVRVDMAGQLGVTITFNDNDGD
jgi:predicted lipoprotein